MRAQPAAAATGQPYGERKAQIDAQRVVPLGAPAPPPAATGGGGVTPGGTSPPPVPLGAPSARPDEPLTAGLPVGPGAGPEALVARRGDDPTLDELRAIYARFPNDGLRSLIEELETGA